MSIIIKTAEQIDGIRKSCQFAASVLKYIEPFVVEGVSTLFLDNVISDYLKQAGAQSATLGYKGYPNVSCISVNEVVCHGVPNETTILKKGDIVNIDITTILNGYYGDTSTMYTIGEISHEAQKLINVAKHCLTLGIQQVRPGACVGNIGHMISQYARSKGYSVVYEYCGHGVGLKFHEDPSIEHTAKKGKGAVIKPGMIFTIEPMINQGKPKVAVDKKDGWTARTIDGRLSAQFEHTVLVTNTGVEVLTKI